MTSKNISFQFMNHTFLLFLIFLLSLKKIESSSLSLKDVQNVCSGADEFIKEYFSGDEKSPEKYDELDQSEIEKGNDENIIKFIFLSKSAKIEYEKDKISKFKTYSNIILFLIIFFCIIILIFEIHFLFRVYYSDKEIKTKNGVTCITFIRINPIGWIKYLCMDQKAREKYFNEYKSQEIIYNKCLFIFFSIIIFIIMIGSVFFAVLNFLDINKTKKSVDNMACSLMKFLYEIKIKPLRQSSFLGFENINTFFSNFSENSNIINTKIDLFTNSLQKCRTQNTTWISSIKKIQEKLSNLATMEFFLYGLPSDTKNMNFKSFSVMGNISDAKKHIYQLQTIYYYYPLEDRNSLLFSINKIFNAISEPVISEAEKFEKKINSQNSNNNNGFNNIYQNVVSLFDKVLSLYIQKLKEEYLEVINNDLKNVLSDIFNLDFTFVLLLILSIPLYIILVLNFYNQNCNSRNKTISTLLMNLIFIFLIASTYQLTSIQNINKKTVYIQDVWRGIAFLFDSKNINYTNDHLIDNIGDVGILIKDNNKFNNLFYYLNYMFNNDGRLFNNSENQTSQFNDSELLSLNKTFNSLNNFLDLYDSNNPNDYLSYSNKEISGMIKEGLTSDTKFQDISGSGFAGTYYEYGNGYLTYINLRTKASGRSVTEWGYKDFDCDEYWSFSTSNYILQLSPTTYLIYYYTNSKNYLCYNCENHYSPKNTNNPPLLNFLEFTLEEVIERYSDLKDTINNAEYNALVYYFTAIEFLRNSSFIEQLQKIYDFNMELTEIQNDTFISLKKIVDSAIEIISRYSNSFNYDIEDKSSNIYCDYLREDLNFVLGEIKNGFLKKIHNVNLFHVLMDVINIMLSIFMIIFYCIISYNFPYFPIKDKASTIKQTIIYNSKKVTKENINSGLLNLHNVMGKNNQVMSSYIPKKNSKEENIRPVIIKITGNDINNNSLYKEVEKENKIENNNFNPKINSSNINLINSCLKDEFDKNKSFVQKQGLGDGDDVNFQSKDCIIGELMNNNGALKLNESKNN